MLIIIVQIVVHIMTSKNFNDDDVDCDDVANNAINTSNNDIYKIIKNKISNDNKNICNNYL